MGCFLMRKKECKGLKIGGERLHRSVVVHLPYACALPTPGVFTTSKLDRHIHKGPRVLEGLIPEGSIPILGTYEAQRL